MANSLLMIAVYSANILNIHDYRGHPINYLSKLLISFQSLANISNVPFYEAQWIVWMSGVFTFKRVTENLKKNVGIELG